jgi:hypothetical protein
MINRRDFLATAGAALVTGPTASLAQAPPGKKLRIVVVANRYHEADGLMAAICNQMKRNPNLGAPTTWSFRAHKPIRQRIRQRIAKNRAV